MTSEKMTTGVTLYRVHTCKADSGVVIVVRYCGSDREKARTAYHEYVPYDQSASPGGPVQTVMQTIDDAGTFDFADDVVTDQG